MKSFKAITAMLVCLTMLFIATPATASAASSSKVTASKGAVVKLDNGCSGYAVTKKHLKKGTSLRLKKVSANSREAKTFAYGESKGWGAKKMAKALKRPKSYSVDTSEVQVFKAYKGKRLRYIVAKQIQAKKPALAGKGQDVTFTIKLMFEEGYESDIHPPQLTISGESIETTKLAPNCSGNTVTTEVTVPEGEYALWIETNDPELMSAGLPKDVSVTVSYGMEDVLISLDCCSDYEDKQKESDMQPGENFVEPEITEELVETVAEPPEAISEPEDAASTL